MVREYISVIWPTGYKYRDEIRELYTSENKILSVSDFTEKHFPDAKAFQKFIFDIYERDDLSREILEYKTGLMMENDHFICSVLRFCAESEVSDDITDESILSIKTKIRNVIAAKMDNYYYDILFHVTDTKSEAEYMAIVLHNYGIS